MLRLLAIEFHKFKYNKPSIILTLIYFGLLTSIALIAIIKFDIGVIKFHLADMGIFNFPYIWHFNTYMASIFKFFLLLVIVSMISNEYSYRTLKQNLIDGLSKKEFILSKFYTVVVLSGVSTLFVFIVSLVLGFIYSDYNELTIITTDAVYRDPSAWYNIIISYDSTDSTAGDRVKIYSNGVLQTLTGTTANLNHTTPFNEASYNLDIGHFGGSSGEFFDGYITETHFIDGTAKAPTDFGEFDDNGVWVPIKYTGSYGNNGFFLEFKQTGTGTDASGIGADTSGNNRHWAVTNLAATDITEDTCTNNFATFNPLARNASNVYTEGNTVYDYTGNFMRCGVSSLGVSSGKWYAEFKRTDATTIHLFGIVADNFVSDGRTVTDTSGNHDYGRGHTGTLFLVSTNSTQDIYLDGSDTNTNVDFTTTTNDIIMIAFDADSKKIWFGKNGTWSSSGDPANGNNPSDTYDGTGTEPFFFSVGTEGTQAIQGNFGNPPFAISSGNTDGKYGNFEYAPPSGYYALCTKRLAEFG